MAAISRTYERDGGFKIMLQENRKKAATLLLPGVSQRIVGGGRRSFCWFICFIHALVTSSPHSSLLSLCSRTHTNFPLSFPPPPEKHKLSTYKSSIPTTSFLLLPLLPFPGLTLALAGPHPVPGLFTLLPSIMQGLISQSRFELRHASAKSGEQNFCAGGSFPFTLA